MTWPSVTISQLNQRQGEINEVERTLLFVGETSTGPGDLIALNSQSDINTLLPAAAASLRQNLLTAQLNAGQNWLAYVLLINSALAKSLWPGRVEAVQDLISVEGVVVISSTDKTAIQAWSDLREKLISSLGRWVWFILTIQGPRTAGESGVDWSGWFDSLPEKVKGVVAAGVQVVHLLWGNEAGALLGLSADLPVDEEEVELTLAQLRQLHDMRLSVPMWYADYEGVYWSDAGRHRR